MRAIGNACQIPKRSCSTREKRHREKRGFRLVPLLARAVQGDNFLSLRGVADRVAIRLRILRLCLDRHRLLPRNDIERNICAPFLQVMLFMLSLTYERCSEI